MVTSVAVIHENKPQKITVLLHNVIACGTIGSQRDSAYLASSLIFHLNESKQKAKTNMALSRAEVDSFFPR
jgi:phosphoheptose isomerase